jgi:hypothetical protein
MFTYVGDVLILNMIAHIQVQGKNFKNNFVSNGHKKTLLFQQNKHSTISALKVLTFQMCYPTEARVRFNFFVCRCIKLKLNTFPNFETPAKIDLSELFFGRLKGYVDFFCHFLLSVIIQ